MLALVYKGSVLTTIGLFNYEHVAPIPHLSHHFLYMNGVGLRL